MRLCLCNSLAAIHQLRARRFAILASGWALGLAVAYASPASAIGAPPPHPPAILRPTAVKLYVHRDIADTRFLADLERRLRTRLQPAVATLPASFDFSALRRFGKLDAQRLIDGLIAGTNWDQNKGAIHVFLIKDDMRLPPARFNFAVSAGSALTPHHVIVVSLARLQETRFFDSQTDTNPVRTATRAYKMVAKNTAKVAGYAGSNACLFSFPRNLAELDAMPEGYCEPDLSALITAGVARPVK